MTHLKTAIYEHLQSDPQIGAVLDSRIYRTFAPQDSAYPFLTYQRITATNQNDIDLTTERFQFDLIGTLEDDDQLEALKESLISRLNGFKGDLGATGLRVTTVWLDVIADGWDEEHRHRRVSLDFQFAYLRHQNSVS